jgi:competence protein ComFC
MQRIWRGASELHDLVLPRACAACGAAIGAVESRLCVECTLSLSKCIGSDYCKSCGRSRGPHILENGRCTSCLMGKATLRFHEFARVGVYHGALKSLILRFKRHFELDQLLGRLLREGILGAFDPQQVDLWCAVPSHWRRRLMLGYQPTGLLLRESVLPWRGRVLPLLRCRKFIPPFHYQQNASASTRAEAIRGAFAVPHPNWVTGKTVCIIDDVMTTGATLGEARRTLRKAGARRVFAAVLACAGPDEAGLT